MRDDKSGLTDFDSGTDEFFVERLLADAKDYVSPTDSMRGKTLDAAEEMRTFKRRERRVGKGLLLASACFWICTLTWPFLSAIQADVTDRKTDELQTRTLDLYRSESLDIQSATAQAYEEWRHSNLNRIHDNSPSVK